jgi:MSHA pilin protein MshC
MSALRATRSDGFTLVELVIVISLMGILGAIAASRMLTSQGFASRGFYDEAQAVVRYAQKTAIAWRRTILVCVSSTEVSAISSNDCNAVSPTYVPHPLDPNRPLKSSAPSGVTLSPTGSFSFDSGGRPSGSGTTITFTSTNTDDPARQIIVAAETGYVYH